MCGSSPIFDFEKYVRLYLPRPNCEITCIFPFHTQDREYNGRIYIHLEPEFQNPTYCSKKEKMPLFLRDHQEHTDVARSYITLGKITKYIKIHAMKVQQNKYCAVHSCNSLKTFPMSPYATLVCSSCLTEQQCVPPTTCNILHLVIFLERYFLWDVSVYRIS